MAFIDGTVVNVALPALQSSLNATAVDLQWVIEAYALCLGALILVGGSLGDQFGRKRVFLAGVTAFTCASMLCGLAPSAVVLVVARLLQGFAGGLVTPQISGFIQTLFQGQERGTAFGLFGTVVGISTGIGSFVT